MQKRQAFIESGVLAADRESGCRLQAGEGDSEQQGDVGVVVEASKPELKKPPMFKVVLLNDDYTPMEFVIHILEKFFGMNREKATQIRYAWQQYSTVLQPGNAEMILSAIG